MLSRRNIKKKKKISTSNNFLTWFNDCYGVSFFKMIPLDSFVAHSADGRLVPVVPGGQNISLNFSNRTEYVERALQYRLHEMDSQV